MLIGYARARGRFGGRPKTMTDEKLDRASKLMKSSDYPVSDICEMVGVSRTTLYRYLKPDGSLRSS